MANEPSKSSQFPLFSKILNGGIAGIVGVSIVYPIDLVKTRLQNQNSAAGEKLYKNMLDCFKKSYRADGYWGMYRGSAVNILLVTPEKAIKLTANDAFRYLLLDKQGKLTVAKEMAAGGAAGLCQTVITTPMELLKIQLQLSAQQSTGRKASALLLTTQLLRTQGLSGLYRGCLSTIMRDVSFSIIYFPLFAHLKALGSERQGSDQVTCEAPFYVSFISGCVAGGVAAVAVNPVDVIKTRLQAQGQSSSKELPSGSTKGPASAGPVIMKPRVQTRDHHQRAFLNTGEPKGGGGSLAQSTVVSESSVVNQRYHGIGDALVRISKEEGWRAFFKGASCRVLVIAPLFGIAQTVYFLGVGEYLLGATSAN